MPRAAAVQQTALRNAGQQTKDCARNGTWHSLSRASVMRNAGQLQKPGVDRESVPPASPLHHS